MRNLADIESLLHAKKLGGTLVSARPLPVDRLAETGVASLDQQLGGGLARGHVSEIVGPRSSGRTSVLCALLAAATRRGEVVALIDTFDTFDPRSGDAAGIDLSRLLWVRGRQGTPRTTPQSTHSIDHAIKASGLVLHAGRFGVVAVDLAEAPVSTMRQLPFTTWRRLARAIEGTETVGVVVGPLPVARSAIGRTIVLGGAARVLRWSGDGSPGRVCCGLDIDARVESTRHPSRPFQLHVSQTEGRPLDGDDVRRALSFPTQQQS